VNYNLTLVAYDVGDRVLESDSNLLCLNEVSANATADVVNQPVYCKIEKLQVNISGWMGLKSKTASITLLRDGKVMSCSSLSNV